MASAGDAAALSMTTGCQRPGTPAFHDPTPVWCGSPDLTIPDSRFPVIYARIAKIILGLNPKTADTQVGFRVLTHDETDMTP